jgi:hypothetical protein
MYFDRLTGSTKNAAVRFPEWRILTAVDQAALKLIGNDIG